MNAVTILILVAGLALSIATFVHDVRRLRVSLSAPQAAPKRIPPEIHLLAGLVTGVGCALPWTWVVGLAVGLVQLVVAVVVAPTLLERLAEWLGSL